MNLADAIQKAHVENERAMASGIPRHQMDEEAKRDVAAFVRWAGDHGVRSLPAAPASIRAFVRSGAVSKEALAPILLAIAEMHDQHYLPNPCATSSVREALTQVLELKPPRSWRRASEQPLFAELPIEVRAVIARREEDRDRELRRLQNELAKLKYRHGGAKPAIEEKEITK